MKTVATKDLQVGMVLIVTKAPLTAPGLIHQICKIQAIDEPYMVIEVGRIVKTNHMIVADEAEFAEPNKDFLIASMPEFILDAEYIEDL